MPNLNIDKIFRLLLQAEKNLQEAKHLMMDMVDQKDGIDFALEASKHEPTSTEENVVEGVFDGQNMIDNHGKTYSIPANYASKSKLVPGDILKLTIQDNGSFLYKQIGPAPRKRIVGTLTYEDGQYKVIAEAKAYNVLLASVTYFKGEIGDKVTIIIPATQESDWACIDNILPSE